jgi:inner membrane protein involved in colicin E2 resistance
MTFPRLLAIGSIIFCTAVGWFILGTSVVVRSGGSLNNCGPQVTGGWGPIMLQPHPVTYYNSPGSVDGRHLVQPSQSNVSVELRYEPKKKGLLWYRTYMVDFRGEYSVQNPTQITQTIYIRFEFPAADASYSDFSFVIDGKPSTRHNKIAEGITDAVTLAPGASAQFVVAYKSRGTERWGYTFGNTSRIQNFRLAMTTDFSEFDFPAGTGSATERTRTANGWHFVWSYPDVINAQSIAMGMPSVANPGPVASRMSFFAPVSLLFFFAVLVLMGMVWRVRLHPMNYFFLAAGCFAFQLLFAYLVDLIPLALAFVISAVVSLALVNGYLFAAAGRRFAQLGAIAQFAYMILFSYSFFFEGLTGLTITIGAIVTLALLMGTTARVNWTEKFGSKANVRGVPPPIPGAAV